ncbi:hypothetical protein [Qipengyuania sp.]|uniref:hypothetical protein n=1 Tax=Qipengyuania sp. TaxID=2004515 RepID=UPI0035C7DEEF
MKSHLVAAAAAFALALPAGGAIAQETMTAVDADGNMYTMTEVQEGMYAKWPADRQTTYDAWPGTYQEYYWSLTPAQQGGWWVLNDMQRERIYKMTPEQRTAAWSAIAAQMNAQTTTPAASANASTTTSGQMRFVSKEMAQPITQRTAASINADDLPVCEPNQQDGCINSWEKNKTGTKPLDHWPGKPASEM